MCGLYNVGSRRGLVKDTTNDGYARRSKVWLHYRGDSKSKQALHYLRKPIHPDLGSIHNNGQVRLVLGYKIKFMYCMTPGREICV